MKRILSGLFAVSLVLTMNSLVEAEELKDSVENITYGKTEEKQNKEYVLIQQSEGYYYYEDLQGQQIGALNKSDVLQSYDVLVGDYTNKEQIEIGAQLAVDLGIPLTKEEIISLTSDISDMKKDGFIISKWNDNGGSWRLAWRKYDEHIRVFLDDQQQEFDQSPILKNERVLVPLRSVFEKMGASVVWDQKTKTVNIQHEEGMVSLQLGATATINGEVVTLDVPSTMVNDRVLVPLRFVSQSLGASVNWLPYYKAVMINYK